MALNATLHSVAVELSDVDRNVYESFDLRLARHPSETAEFLLTRLLAYCLEHREGIGFSAGVCVADEPAVWVRDLRGEITDWIEIGSPDAERLHRAAKKAERVAVYTQRDPGRLKERLAGKTVHRAESIELHGFGPGWIDAVAPRLGRRARLALSRTGGRLYLDLDGTSHETDLETVRLA